jgi:sporulation protein YlmC with PRC-barrel domain
MAEPIANSASTTGNHNLILASRVEDTEVYNPAGEHIGHISDLSVDRRSGQVIYAIMSFGGFLGLGKQYHPLPWGMLVYDPERGGYVVPLDKEALENAPAFGEEDLSRFGGEEHSFDRNQLYEYYARYGLPTPFF